MNSKIYKEGLRGKRLKVILVIILLGIAAAGAALINLGGKNQGNSINKNLASDKEAEEGRRVSSAMAREPYVNMEEMTDLRLNKLKPVETPMEEADKAPEVNSAEEAVENQESPEEEIDQEEPKEQEEVAMVGKTLNVGLINQLPDLYNGCEVTSLAMLLNYKGVGVSKLELADRMVKDDTSVVKDDNGNILIWGNPNVGFVGDVTGKAIGFSINPGPLLTLVNEYYSGGGANLTGCSLEELKASIDRDNPVLVWINENFILPIEYMSWQDCQGNEVWANINTHTVLLTGYDQNNFYYNDPLYGYKDAAINLHTFEAVWGEMGRKALTVN